MSPNTSQKDLNQTGITGAEFLSSGNINASRNSHSFLMAATEKRDSTRFQVYKKPSITDTLSPTEMIRATMKTSFGIEGYEVPANEQLKRAGSFMFFKSKAPGPIQGEAEFRKQFPGAG